MRRRLSIGLILQALVLCLTAGSALAEETIIPTHLSCERPDGTNFLIDTVPWSDQEVAYLADHSSQGQLIVFAPKAAQERPEAVVRIDFARACLSLLNQPDDLCSAVQFLSARDALNLDDVEQLEMYYISLADQRPDRADEAYADLKQIFACF